MDAWYGKNRADFVLEIEVSGLRMNTRFQVRRNRQGQHWKLRLCSAFTLLELLVVMSIVVLLLAASLPTVTGMGRGASLQGAVSNVRSTLSLARQWAITNRKYTYVVFPGVDEVAASTGDTYAYRAYAVYEYDPISREGRYVTEWKFLPKGIVFDDDTSKSNNVFDRTTEQIKYPSNDDSEISVHVLPFRPTGRTGGSAPYEVFLREGFSEVVGGELDYGLVHADQTTFGVKVSALSGGVKVVEY